MSGFVVGARPATNGRMLAGEVGQIRTVSGLLDLAEPVQQVTLRARSHRAIGDLRQTVENEICLAARVVPTGSADQSRNDQDGQKREVDDRRRQRKEVIVLRCDVLADFIDEQADANLRNTTPTT